MIIRSTVAQLALVSSIALSSGGPAAAWHYGHNHGGGAEALIGGVVGGIIGGAIAGGANRAAEPKAAAPKVEERVIVRERVVERPRPQVNSYEREQNRSVQVALNYFGFAVGAPDGVLGRQSRSAISAYQGLLGFPATGYLTDYERNFLLSSQARAQANQMQTASLMQQMGMGPSGVLVAYHTNQTAGAVMQQPQAVMVQPQAPAAQPQVVINNTLPAAQPAPQTQAAAAPAPAPAAPAPVEVAAAPAPMMPSFIGGPVEASMASYCNKTSLVTTGNGGMVTAVSMTEPTLALGEQFCLARTYAIDEGERLTATVQGVTLAQMQEQCAAFAPTMRDYVAGLVAKAPTDATSDLQSFVIKSGMNPSQLSANARICLSIGYRSDNADVALASALVLVGLGEAAYGEMLAHHMAQGFGAPKRLDRAADWYDATVTALEAGAQRVVAPGAAERPAVLRAAAVRLRGGAPAPATPQAAALPSFGMPGPATAASTASN